jgi:ketosteroid isomerase-like protein
MRRTLSAATFLALMVPTMGRADDTDSEKQVASLSQHNYAALVAGNTSALDAILSDDWLVIDPFGEVISKARQAKELKDGTTDFVSIDSSDVKVRVYGDAAVVTGRYQVKLKIRGRENTIPVRITESFAKQGGKLRCVSTQVTSIADHPGRTVDPG